ncbi:hypothetical protein BG000_002831, partial [Podila horticola]
MIPVGMPSALLPFWTVAGVTPAAAAAAAVELRSRFDQSPLNIAIGFCTPTTD